MQWDCRRESECSDRAQERDYARLSMVYIRGCVFVCYLGSTPVFAEAFLNLWSQN
jgi:hypothetical protein